MHISFSLLILLIIHEVSDGNAERRTGNKVSLETDDLECYQCNNGLKEDDACVSDFLKMETTTDCKTPEFFFTMLSVVSGEFLRRSPRRGRPRLIRDASTKKTMGMCATVFIFGAELIGPQVMRDCIQGGQKEIEDGFKMLLPPANFQMFRESFNSSFAAGKIKVGAGEFKSKSENNGMHVVGTICTSNKCNLVDFETYQKILNKPE